MEQAAFDKSRKLRPADLYNILSDTPIDEVEVKKLDQGERKLLLSALKVLKNYDDYIQKDEKLHTFTMTTKDLENIAKIKVKLKAYSEKPADSTSASLFVKVVKNIFKKRISPKKVMKEYRKLRPRGQVQDVVEEKTLNAEEAYIKGRGTNLATFREELQNIKSGKNFEPEQPHLHKDASREHEALPDALTSIISRREQTITEHLQKLKEDIKEEKDSKTIERGIKKVAQLCDLYEKDLNFLMQQIEAKKPKPPKF